MYLLLQWSENGIKWSETNDRAKVDKWLDDSSMFRWAFYREHGRHVREVRSGEAKA